MLDRILTLALTPAARALDAALTAWDFLAGPTPAVVDGVGPWTDLDEATAAL